MLSFKSLFKKHIKKNENWCFVCIFCKDETPKYRNLICCNFEKIKKNKLLSFPWSKIIENKCHILNSKNNCKYFISNKNKKIKMLKQTITIYDYI